MESYRLVRQCLKLKQGNYGLITVIDNTFVPRRKDATIVDSEG